MLLNLTTYDIRMLLKGVTSVIEFDLYFFLMNLIKSNEKKIKINFDINEFQNITNRNSKGILHYVKAIDLLNKEMMLFKDFERLGDTFVIKFPNNTESDISKGYTTFEDEIFSFGTISEKKLYVYLKSIQYKRNTTVELKTFRAIGIGYDVYKISSIIKKMNIISKVVKEKNDDLTIEFLDVIKPVKELKEVFTAYNVIEEKKSVVNNSYNKPNTAPFMPQKFYTSMSLNKTAVEEKVVELKKNVIEKKGVSIKDEIVPLLEKKYNQELFRLYDVEITENNNVIDVIGAEHILVWIRDNRFNLKIANTWTSIKNSETPYSVNLIII